MTRGFEESEKTKLLGKIERGAKKKPRGFWMDRLQVLFEARDIKLRHGLTALPSSSKLKELGYSGFVYAVHRHHGGLRKIREQLGEGQLKKQDGLWRDLQYTIREAQKFMEEHGFDVLPAAKKLQDLGASSLSNAISLNGGFRKFRRILGEPQKRVSTELLKERKYVLSQVKELMGEYNFEVLPSQNRLEDLGYGGLAQAIMKYHGGFRTFRRSLGEDPLRVEDGLWRDLGFAITEAYCMMEAHGYEELPSQSVLRDLGYYSLTAAISKYHGGLAAFRHLMKERSKEKVDSVDALVQELVEEHNG